MAFWAKLRSKISKDASCIDDILDESEKAFLRSVIHHDVWRRDLEHQEIVDGFATYRAFRRKQFIGHPILTDFATELLAHEVEAWESALQSWPLETDCDRLSQVFAKLNQMGVVALENCGGTLSEATAVAAEEFERRLDEGQVPSDTDIARYVCYHEQDIESAIDGHGLWLAFGAMNWQDGSDEEAQSLELAATCKTLLEERGFEVSWNGSTEQRLQLKGFRWQRRELFSRE
jgi:hypothetical protein